MKKYKVTLTAAERQQLSDLIATGRGAAAKLTHARVLLKADAADGGPAWPDARVAEAVEVSASWITDCKTQIDGDAATIDLTASAELRIRGQAYGRLGGVWTLKWRRYPDGWRITAIIPRNHERIADTLGEFIESNFLACEPVDAKLREVDFAALVVDWLADRERSAALAVP